MKADRPRLLRRVLIYLLLATVLLSIPATSTYGVAHRTCNPSTGYFGTCADVSPGKYSQKLGVDFPTFSSVKLSYPNSSILVNSIGDLLFNMTLTPLMLDPLSAQVGFNVLGPWGVGVQVWGSGFWLGDTSCSLSGTPVQQAPPPTCTIAGGILTGSFVVENVPAGLYTITATGSPGGDSSSYTFTVLPPSLVLNPSSGPTGITVQVRGFGFYTTDACITLTGDGSGISPVAPPIVCLIAGGILTGSFVVNPLCPPGTYTIVVTTTGDDTGKAQASFTVTATPQYITLSSSSGKFGDPAITILPFPLSQGFLAVIGICSLSGIPVTKPTPPCTIAAGIPTGSFVIADVTPGVYTITVTGDPGADSASANFQVLPSPPSEPISVPISIGIYVPPDFTGLALSKTWSSFTNNYDSQSISVSRQSSADSIGPNWWSITVSNVTVTHSPSSYSLPLVGHRIFVTGQSQYIRLFQVTSPSTAGRYFFKVFINGQSIGASNFPTLTVEGSRDPAYISGTLRDLGDRNVTNAGQPIDLPKDYGAQVVATGLDYLGDPASAQTFINYTAKGQYTLFGVAPGTYNITAYAAGYHPTIKPTTVSVAAAQSLAGVDIYMSESVNITGTVLSENAAGGLIPWGTLVQVNPFGSSTITNRPISIKILDLNGTVMASTPAPYNVMTFTDNKATSFSFSVLREVAYDGRIPQDYANYTSGLGWGDYLLQAYVTSYVQLAEVRVHVANETTQTRSVIPLIRTGIFNVTVHFKNSTSTDSTLMDNPITVGGTLSVSAYDMQGILRAQNVTFVKAGSNSATVELQGFSNARSFGIASLFQQNYGLLPGTYYFKASFTASPIFAGFANLGVANLYYQTEDIQASIGLGEGVVELSFPLYKAGGIQLTIYSVDDQLPPLSEPWRFPGKTIKITIIPKSALPTIYQTNSTQPIATSSKTLEITGLQTDSYDVIIQTLGYTQERILHLNVVLCGITDALVQMIENPVIDLRIAFKNEGLLSIIDSTQPYAQPINHLNATPARIEVFDDRGNFVAANASYIPNKSSSGVLTRIANFTLAGFDVYFGDPRSIWSGFYDTTDGARQNSGGLFLYPWDNQPREYTIRVWVDGYYQFKPLHVTIQPRGNVSLVGSMDRASRISGTVAGPDFYEIARPLSWATISLEPNNNTLTGIIDVRPGNYVTASLDGSFQVWVPQGRYGMGVSLEGYSSYSAQIDAPSGSDMTMWIWLDNFQASPQIAMSALFNVAPAVTVRATSRPQQ